MIQKKKEGCAHPSSFTDQAQSVDRSVRLACVPIRAEQAHLLRMSWVSEGNLR